jgi:hypothetical protein
MGSTISPKSPARALILIPSIARSRDSHGEVCTAGAGETIPMEELHGI